MWATFATKTTLHEIYAQVFLRFSDSSKPSQSVLLIYKMAWLAEIRKSDENLLKSCKVAPVTKVQITILTQHVCNTSSDWTVGKSSGSKMTIYVPQLLRQNAVDSLAQLSR